jgi:tellurite resistance protein
VIQLRVPAPVDTSATQALDTIELAIQLAFAVARADGRLAQAEKTVIDEHIAKIYSHDQPLLSRARALCAHYETGAIDVDDCLRRIKDRFDTPGRTALVKLAIDIAAASGGIKQREQEFLAKLSRSLEIPLPSEVLQPQAPAAPVAQTPNTPEALAPVPPAGPTDPRALLEIEPGTRLSADLIRRNFNRLWERLDPDKMTGMGTDFVAMAQAKRAALRAAACTLIEPFGEELEPKAEPAPARNMRDNPDLDQVFGV